MVAAATRPNATASNLVTLTVQVEGQDLPGTVGLIAADISKAVNRIPVATLVFYDGNPAEQSFEVSSSDLLTPGKQLRLSGGYDSNESVLFEGIITRQRIQVRKRGESRLHIEVRDAAFRMALDRKSKYFKEVTESDLFEEIVGVYNGITLQMEPTSVSFPEIVQYYVSDWDFLVTRAEKNGMVCLANDGTLKIEKPNPQQEPVTTLGYGTGLFDVDLELDVRSQPKQVVAQTWSPANQELLTAEVDDVPAPDQGNLDGPTLADVTNVDPFLLQHSGALTQQDIDAWAEAQMLKARFARIRGILRFQGTANIKPGDVVELEGLGDRFNGNAWVSGVRHSLGAGDWETMLQIGLQAQWHQAAFPVDAPPASNFSPAINGLQVGVVTQLEADPGGEDRILVRLPVISAEGDGTWCRLATLDAGENRGSFFRPEIGDEVIVGFINDDPNQAVILGMVHSSSKPAPQPATDDNHEKGFVTRSGMRVIFNDDKQSITIDTPNGNQIVIDDDAEEIKIQDQGNNSITLKSDGIALESPKDIVLKATGNVKIEGRNVNLKAKANLSAEGSAGAALKSSGTTNVKGSLVQIN